jgi:Rrf2 family nitric oxide-sensitive transcriptional repressor
MHLTQFSDYGLRILLYLGVHPPGEDGSLPTLFDISQAYAISFNHLSKVAQQLTRLGLVVAQRGRTGGMRLGRSPEQIRIGEVVRATESNFRLVECFDPSTNQCAISESCQLKGVLLEARTAFLDTLDRYTLADMLKEKQQLIQIWNRPTKRRSP